jgi:hypothetical protein
VPIELYRALSWDLSPLRPWEYWQVDQAEWTEAIQVRIAYQDGVDDANDEAEAAADLLG